MENIKNIVVDSNPAADIKVYGLGDDNRVYWWNWIKLKWVLAEIKVPKND